MFRSELLNGLAGWLVVNNPIIFTEAKDRIYKSRDSHKVPMFLGIFLMKISQGSEISNFTNINS